MTPWIIDAANDVNVFYVLPCNLAGRPSRRQVIMSAHKECYETKRMNGRTACARVQCYRHIAISSPRSFQSMLYQCRACSCSREHRTNVDSEAATEMVDGRVPDLRQLGDSSRNGSIQSFWEAWLLRFDPRMDVSRGHQVKHVARESLAVFFPSVWKVCRIIGEGAQKNAAVVQVFQGC